MSFSWPDFSDQRPIDESHTWSAVFDSYDQRNDNCYYALSILEKDRTIQRFVTCIDLSWAGDDWTGEEFINGLVERLQSEAKRGCSNTAYRGYGDDPEASHLIRQVRNGDLPRWKLEAAALVGHIGAIVATKHLGSTAISRKEAAEIFGLELCQINHLAESGNISVIIRGKRERLSLVELFRAWRADTTRNDRGAIVMTCLVLRRLHPLLTLKIAELLIREALRWDIGRTEAVISIVDAVSNWLENPTDVNADVISQARRHLPENPPGCCPSARILAARYIAQMIDHIENENIGSDALEHSAGILRTTNFPFFTHDEIELYLLWKVFDGLLTWALGYPARAPRPSLVLSQRYRVVEQTTERGDAYELDRSSTFYVVDNRTNEMIMDFSGSSSNKLGDSGWEPLNIDGVIDVSIAPEERNYVIVRTTTGTKTLSLPSE